MDTLLALLPVLVLLTVLLQLATLIIVVVLDQRRGPYPPR